MADFGVDSGGVGLAGEEAGEGPAIVGLHGLTATRRYVVMGSRMLERAGHRMVLYDARGHGASGPAPSPEAYTYEDLATDLEAVLDDRGIDRAVLVGASMGAHTIVRFALDHPERAAGIVLVTPAFDPDEERSFERWDALATGLRDDGIEGFLRAGGAEGVPEKWRETVEKVIRQRFAGHENLDAVADALGAVPRSDPFASWDDLARLDMPAVVVASRDEADPGHPYATGVRYCEALPDARLATEDPGSSPIAWQGGQLSRVIGELAERVRA